MKVNYNPDFTMCEMLVPKGQKHIPGYISCSPQHLLVFPHTYVIPLDNWPYYQYLIYIPTHLVSIP